MLKEVVIIIAILVVAIPRFLYWYYSITIDQADDVYDFIIGKLS